MSLRSPRVRELGSVESWKGFEGAYEARDFDPDPHPRSSTEVASRERIRKRSLTLGGRSSGGLSCTEGPELARGHRCCQNRPRRRRETVRAKSLRDPNGAYMWPGTYSEREMRGPG